MTQGHVTHAAQAGVHVLRYFGAVNFTLAPGLDRFLQGLIRTGKVSGLVFDLSAAESLDSTNLGLMARVNEQVHDLGAANRASIKPSTWSPRTAPDRPRSTRNRSMRQRPPPRSCAARCSTRTAR